MNQTDTAYDSEEELGAFIYRSSLATRVQANEHEVNEQAPTERNGGSPKKTISDGTHAKKRACPMRAAKRSHLQAANKEDALVSMDRKRPDTQSNSLVKRRGKSKDKDTNTIKRVGPKRAAKKKCQYLDSEEIDKPMKKSRKKTCSHEECNNVAQLKGMCKRHFREAGGVYPYRRKKCSADGCTSNVQGGCEGMCKKHFREAGGVYKTKQCSVDGCTTSLHGGCKGMCMRHFVEAGGAYPYQRKKCSVNGCTTFVHSGCEGMCMRHFTESGGVFRLTCIAEGCTKWAITLASHQGMCRGCYNIQTRT